MDHICPWADCGDWFSVRERIEALKGKPDLVKRMRDGRDAVGNGIGNLRLVSASDNRGDRDADISKKMDFLIKDHPSKEDKADMGKFAMPLEGHVLWKQVSRSGKVAERQWDEPRLTVLQQVVEQRAAWLYNRFYNELDYAKWVPAKKESVNSGE